LAEGPEQLKSSCILSRILQEVYGAEGLPNLSNGVYIALPEDEISSGSGDDKDELDKEGGSELEEPLGYDEGMEAGSSASGLGRLAALMF
jgi:hypothetical protein